MPQIAIDTNIFLHLLNDQNNPGSHIDQLLSHLAKRSYRLCVDTTNKIGAEYVEYLDPILRNQDDNRIQIYILRFWMNPDNRDLVELDALDTRMTGIRQVIHEANEHADRAFVYVACKSDCKLVTNDNPHILSRRQDLRRRTRGNRGPNTDFISSLDAVQQII